MPALITDLFAHPDPITDLNGGLQTRLQTCLQDPITDLQAVPIIDLNAVHTELGPITDLQAVPITDLNAVHTETDPITDLQVVPITDINVRRSRLQT